MKKTLLIGLAAVALGSMTACSNILEEEGVISAKTGTLTIALEADGSLDVATKAGETTTITLPSDIATEMTVTAKHNVLNTIQNLTNPSVNNNVYTYTKSELATGAYTVTALYGEMEGNLDFGTPIFEGVNNNVVVTNSENPEAIEIEATLQNSIIVVDPDMLTTFKDKANVSELYVYQGEANTQPAEGKFSLLGSPTENLFVKKGLENIYIYIAGTVKKDGTTFGQAVKISTVTEAAKKYVVKYSLVEATGTMKLNIDVNGTVTQVDIDATVNPYL